MASKAWLRACLSESVERERLLGVRVENLSAALVSAEQVRDSLSAQLDRARRGSEDLRVRNMRQRWLIVDLKLERDGLVERVAELGGRLVEIADIADPPSERPGAEGGV